MKAWIDQHYKAITILIFILGFAFRLVNLEQDLPPYNQTGLSQTDESYYCFWAINDLLREQHRTLDLEELKGYEKNIIISISYPFTYFSVKLFGYNYIGLRFGVVFGYFLSVVLIYLSLRILSIDKFILLGMLIMLFSDYYFSAIGRCQNPQIYSVLSLSLFLFFAVKGLENHRYIFGATCIAVLSVLMVYPYTLYALFGYGLFNLFCDIKTRKIDQVKYIAGGIIAGFLIFSIILYAMDSSLSDFISFYGNFMGERDERIDNPFHLKNILLAFLQFVFTNLFRYNFAYFFILLLFLVHTITSRFSSKLMTLLTCIFVGAYVQAFFSSSYPFKKWVTLSPFVFVMVGSFLQNISTYTLKHKYIKMGFILLGILLFLIMLKTTHNLAFWSSFSYGYTLTPIPSVYIIVQVVLWILFLGAFWTQKRHLIMLSIILTAWIYNLKNQHLEATFFHRDFLTFFNQNFVTNHTILTSGFSHSYTFYNQSIPLINPYYIHKKINNIDFVPRFNHAPYKLMYIEKTKGGNITPLDIIEEKGHTYQFLQRKYNEVYGFNLYQMK